VTVTVCTRTRRLPDSEFTAWGGVRKIARVGQKADQHKCSFSVAASSVPAEAMDFILSAYERGFPILLYTLQ
jgi:hypothetical protein